MMKIDNCDWSQTKLITYQWSPWTSPLLTLQTTGAGTTSLYHLSTQCRLVCLNISLYYTVYFRSQKKVEYTPRENLGEKLGMAFLPIIKIPSQAVLQSVTHLYGFSLCTMLCTLKATMLAPCTVKAEKYVVALTLSPVSIKL